MKQLCRSRIGIQAALCCLLLGLTACGGEAQLEPAPTPVPTQATAVAPSPTPVVTLAPATPLATGDLAERSLGYVAQLTQDLGRRRSASQEELLAARFLKEEWESMGYETEIQAFTIRLRGGGERESRNVVAIKRGSPSSIIVLGAHYDTLGPSPGANDNASGTATILTIAREVAELETSSEVRFVAFGSEELELFGSAHYVRSLTFEERSSIVAMLNFDALGTGPVLEISGDPRLLETVKAVAGQVGVEVRVVELPRGTSSDHSNFLRVRIPAVIVSSGDFSRIHTAADTIEFVDKRLLRDAALLGLHLLLRDLR